MKIKILGVSVDPCSMKEALDAAFGFLEDGRQHYIVTPNPEMIVDAQHDKEFFKILNGADLAIPDGIGLIKASTFLNMSLREKVSGVDFVSAFIANIHGRKAKYTVAFLGGGEGVAEAAKKKLSEKYPDCCIILALCGPDLSRKSAAEESAMAVEAINKAGANILFVAFGHVAQEKWIYHHLRKMKTVKIAMGVGGAFDILSGRIKRAPRFFRHHGIEWVWRFFLEPKKRAGRIYKAVLLFPYEIFKSRRKTDS